MADDRYVVVLGIDGLRPDMISERTMPVLAALKAQSAFSEGHRTVYPSETRCALTALACGARPEATGILGNEFFARGMRPELSRTNTIHDWNANEARLPGGFVTATSLSDVLGKAGRRLAVINSSGQGSMTALNWQGARFPGHAAITLRNPQIAFPATLAADIEAAHDVPPGGHGRMAATDAVEVFTRSVWPTARPDVAILWVTEVDGASHRYGLGAEGMLRAMTHCDQALAALLDWRESLPEKDAVTLIVTSDHGHSTIGEFVSVSDTLAQAGITPQGIVSRRGRAPAFWLNGGAPEQLADIASVLRAQPWAGAMFSAPAAPDAPEGVLPGTLSVALTGVGHHRAPDLIVHLHGTEDENPHGIPGVTACDARGYGTPLGGGTHGGMHPSELNAVLIATGAGIKGAGAHAACSGIQDLTPTILSLLGLPAAASMRGRVLGELLAEGAAPGAPAQTAFEAAAGDVTSRIEITQVDGHPYVTAADALGPDRPQARKRRDDLVVAAD